MILRISLALAMTLFCLNSKTVALDNPQPESKTVITLSLVDAVGASTGMLTLLGYRMLTSPDSSDTTFDQFWIAKAPVLVGILASASSSTLYQYRRGRPIPLALRLGIGAATTVAFSLCALALSHLHTS